MSSKCARLPEHRINERCLAVVNVSNNRDVSKVIALFDGKIFEMRLLRLL
jgi:hypothetical protein